MRWNHDKRLSVEVVPGEGVSAVKCEELNDFAAHVSWRSPETHNAWISISRAEDGRFRFGASGDEGATSGWLPLALRLNRDGSYELLLD